MVVVNLENNYELKFPKQLSKEEIILGIAEKPTAAAKIASALDIKNKKISIKINKNFEGSTQKISEISVYSLKIKNKDMIIIPALGHLFTLIQDGYGWQYPVYDFKWVPINQSIKPTYITSFHRRIEATIEVFRYFVNNSEMNIIMTDYDDEGETIGALLLSELINDEALISARRMRYSTFAKKEIINSFENAFNGNLPEAGINFGMYKRGLMRHYLDWLWGINLSRALILSLRNTSGRYMTLSTGRVQGPTLNFIANRQFEIDIFVPVPRFKIDVAIKNRKRININYNKPYIKREQIATKIIAKVINQKAIVDKITVKESRRPPPPPYNLSSLQKDAYRYYKITPSRTLKAAENLYLEASISYPRTSSEKYPPGLNHHEILTKLEKRRSYLSIINNIKKNIRKPIVGKANDPAHPCIYPTGIIPSKKGRDETKIFNLIISRYFATFGDSAIKENNRVDFKINSEIFYISGSRTTYLGWRAWAGIQGESKDEEIPNFTKNKAYNVIAAEYQTKYTQPPPRYNQSSLLKKMEDVQIGTKATRSEIIKNLFDRNFLKNDAIEITPIGSVINEVLSKYGPKVISVELSRKLEQMGDLIQKSYENISDGTLFTLSDALVQGVTYLHQILYDLKNNEKNIGYLINKNLLSQRRSETIIGDCMVCKLGKLKIITSTTTGKRFIGCSRYFENRECDVSYPLPQKGRLAIMNIRCKADGFPQIKVYSSKKPWILCLNPKCPIREERDKKIKHRKKEVAK